MLCHPKGVNLIPPRVAQKENNYKLKTLEESLI